MFIFFFQFKQELVSNFTKDVLPLFENGAFKPIIHTVLSLEKIAEAHKLMEANVNTGKIILTVNSGDEHQDLWYKMGLYFGAVAAQLLWKLQNLFITWWNVAFVCAINRKENHNSEKCDCTEYMDL